LVTIGPDHAIDTLRLNLTDDILVAESGRILALIGYDLVMGPRGEDWVSGLAAELPAQPIARRSGSR
jgi:hypothetical protein